MSAACTRDDCAWPDAPCVVEVPAAKNRWRGLYDGTPAEQKLVNSEALARLLRDHEVAVVYARERGKTLRLIFGLLAQRRWWNGNVAAAYQLAKEALLNVR